MKNSHLIGILLILCLAMASILLGLNIPIQDPGSEVNNGFSASSETIYKAERALTDTETLLLDSAGNEFIISIEGRNSSWIPKGTVIHLTRK